jgi:hypothetical protein
MTMREPILALIFLAGASAMAADDPPPAAEAQDAQSPTEDAGGLPPDTPSDAAPAEPAESEFKEEPAGAAVQDPGLIGEDGKPAARTTAVDPRAGEGFIDKGRIAADTQARLVGLRESGNPHIPSGLLISGIKDEQDREEANLRSMREDAIRMYARHEGYAERVRDVLSGHTEEQAEEAQAPEFAPPEAKGSRRLFFAVVGSVLIAAAGLVLILYRWRPDR